MNLRRRAFSWYLSAVIFALFVSSGLQGILLIGGFYVPEVLLLPIAYLSRRNVLFTSYFSSQYSILNLYAVFIILGWSLVSLFFATPLEFRLIFSETRSLVYLVSSFLISSFLLSQKKLGDLLSVFLFSGFAYPLIYFFFLAPSLIVDSQFKLFPQIPLFILVLGAAIFLRLYRIAALLYAVWFPVFVFSFFRSSLVYAAYYLLVLVLYLIFPRGFNASRIRDVFLFLLVIISACFLYPSFSSLLNSFLEGFYSDSVLGSTQIIHKLNNAGVVDSDLTRINALTESLSFNSVLPSLLPYGSSFDIDANGGLNNFDSGFLYISRRFGTPVLIFLFGVMLFKNLRRPGIMFCFLLPVSFLLFFSGSFSNIGSLCVSLGVVLAICFSNSLSLPQRFLA